MSKVLRFLAFMAPLVLGALIGNALAVRIWPELKEKSPWFWLATGANGALGGILATRLIFRKRRSAERAPKTDPVIPEAPSDPKTYEEWRKDLDRTVDENAPDFLHLDDFVRKWSEIPRTSKKKPFIPLPELPESADERIGPVTVTPTAAKPTPNVLGAPENIMRYVQKRADDEIVGGKKVIDPFDGKPTVQVTEAGVPFNREASGPVNFVAAPFVDALVILIDGMSYVLPLGAPLTVHMQAGWHFAQAVVAPRPLACNGHPQRSVDYGGP